MAPPEKSRGTERRWNRGGTSRHGRVTSACHVTGAKAEAWCLLIHAEASLSLCLLATSLDTGGAWEGNLVPTFERGSVYPRVITP